MKKTTFKPRKIPAQARSRATVDAIVQASTYILTKVGWEGLTTNAIAERAGVNIASLYQFFPNKEAVIAELQRRHAIETRSDVRKVLDMLPKQPSLRNVLKMLVELSVEEHRAAPAVHRAIYDELPRTVRYLEEDKVQLRGQLLEVIMPFMHNVPNPDLATYMMSVAAHAIIHSATAERPELLSNPQFVEELVTLLEKFIDRPSN